MHRRLVQRGDLLLSFDVFIWRIWSGKLVREFFCILKKIVQSLNVRILKIFYVKKSDKNRLDLGR